MAEAPRMTIPTQLVLRALLEDPSAELYGVEIGQAAGLRRGTVHPILARLEKMAWLQSTWEDVDKHVVGRPPRRYYRLTGAGVEAARHALAGAYRSPGMLGARRPVTEQ